MRFPISGHGGQNDYVYLIYRDIYSHNARFDRLVSLEATIFNVMEQRNNLLLENNQE